MKKNNIKKIALPVILLSLFTFSNITLASEITGILSTGISSSLGNGLTGTVITTSNPSHSGGGGVSGSNGGNSSTSQTGRADINGDGKVNILDMVILMAVVEIA